MIFKKMLPKHGKQAAGNGTASSWVAQIPELQGEGITEKLGFLGTKVETNRPRCQT